MPTHLALLRGINVGRGPRIPMADLRAVVTGLGHTEVQTYVQSGNIVFTPHQADADRHELARELSAAVADHWGLHRLVVVLTAADWAQIREANPFATQAADAPTTVHAAVQQDPIGSEQQAQLTELLARSRAEGAEDDLVVSGQALYLHTPGGLGRSTLGELLARVSAAGQDQATMRNWRTVEALRRLLDDSSPPSS